MFFWSSGHDEGVFNPSTLRHGSFIFLSSINSNTTVLQQKIHQQAEPSNLSINNDKEPERTAPDLEDMEPPNQAVSNIAAGNQPTSARTSLLDLPPELRVMIYRYVLRLPFDITYDPNFWSCPRMQAWTSILFTSRLIRRESIAAFFSENTFDFGPDFSRLSVVPSQRFSNMIQNFTALVNIYRPSPSRLREEFAEIIRTVEDPAIVRGIFTVTFALYPQDLERPLIDFYLGLLCRLTHFRTVRVDFLYDIEPSPYTVAMNCDLVNNALRSVLGPATFSGIASQLLLGLIFHPQKFLSAQSSRQYVNEIGDETVLTKT